MPVIKLDAVPSTNDFLREMVLAGPVERFTVVVAENQTHGRGQTGSSWVSEPGKNLTFSVFVPNAVKDAGALFTLNLAAALAVAEALESTGVPRVSVKWPNDILSGNRKLGGILIENSIGTRINSVIGIGINVNQQSFDGLPSASSIFVETGCESDKYDLLDLILTRLTGNIEVLASEPQKLWRTYHDKLFMMGRTALFQIPDGQKFMGSIKGVGPDGKLILELEDHSIKSFAVREISMVY